jgi:Flp pilus assembly protein TadG
MRMSRPRRLPRRRPVLRSLGDCKSGVSIIEFAFALPIVMLVATGGLECANVALAHLRISQIATTVADTSARVLTQMDESDIYEVFSGVDMMGNRINFAPNGRVVLSNLEPNGQTGAGAGQKITWQRCYGSLTSVAPAYGVQGTGATNNTLAGGMGPTGKKITAATGTAVMFVEVTYNYQPLVYDVLNVGKIRYEAAFNVRERTSYSITNTQNRAVRSC